MCPTLLSFCWSLVFYMFGIVLYMYALFLFCYECNVSFKHFDKYVESWLVH